eukprot:PRCOL_00000800-RA
MAVASAAVAAPAPCTGTISEPLLWGEGNKLQTQVVEIGENTTAIRCLDWDRARFDIEFGLDNGTTYNSFVIKGADKIALVDASHEKFGTDDLYMRALESVVDPADIDYLICSHTEPDHSFLIPAVLERAPNATVVATKVALTFLDQQINGEYPKMMAKPGGSLDLGGGHMLQFTAAPNLHWPDTMFTFDEKTQILYTCDAFGQHLCTEETFDANLQEILPHYRFYYDCLMRPNARSVVTALRKSKDMDYLTVAVGHGQLLRHNLAELKSKYETWSAEALEKAAASVCVLYCADYGFSDRLSQAVARGITKTGCGVEMHDLMSTETQELTEAIAGSAGVVVMAPPHDTAGAEALGTVLASVNSKQKFLVVESYGGDDEPVDMISSSLAQAGLSVSLDPVKVRDEPTQATYQECEETGTDLGQLLTSKSSLLARKTAMSNDVAKALGKVSGGLYVVTAAQGDSRSAMIASWVAQASFEPLGLTIAVAKDRAIESLMQEGDAFVLNMLPEGDYGGTMKHFLKRFPPGADRFEGVGFRDAECGSPVLDAASAHVELRVSDRMETSDHWIVYAEATGGAVSTTKPTATHRRAVASYY